MLLETAGALSGLAYLARVDPHDATALVPVCPIKWVSGLDCPACGGMRMVHDLLHGDVRAAARDNVFLLAASPALLYLLVLHVRSVRRGEPADIPKRISYVLAAAAVGWMLVRNLPRWSLKPTVL